MLPIADVFRLMPVTRIGVKKEEMDPKNESAIVNKRRLIMGKGRKQVVQVVGLCLMVFCLGVRCPEASGAEITLRYAGNLPIDHFVTRGQYLYAKSIMERTNNKVKVEVYPAGQLFSDKDMVKALPSGAVDMAEVTVNQWSGRVPMELLVDWPFFYKDRNHLHRLMDSEFGDILRQEFEKANVKVLYWMDTGGSAFASKMPLRTLEDFKGKRIRGTGEIICEGIMALGAATVFLGGGEVYMALQRGTIDGANSLISSLWERKYYEITKYITCPYFNYSTFAILINKKKWDSLPKDVQEAMLEAGKEGKEWARKEAEKIDKECLVGFKEKGMDVYDPPEKEKARWREACKKPLVDNFLNRVGEEKAKAKFLLELSERTH